MRSLSPDEAELWARVASTIRPLSRETNSLTPITPARPESSKPRVAPRTAYPSTPHPTAPATGQRTLDGTWDRRLGKGLVEPDRVIDLHGMNLDGAWRAIDRSLEQSIARGDRLVLLITGHHRPGEPPVERGKIRAAVHDWLDASRHAARIAAVRPAHRRHGGGGSLYLIIKR